MHAVLWNALGPGSVAYALGELLDNLPQESVDRTLWCLGGHPVSPRDYHRPALPNSLFSALCRVGVPAHLQGRIATEVALRSIKQGDIVYLWPPYDLRLIKKAQERGAIVIAERTNCMGKMGRNVLARAYARRRLPLPSGWFPPEDIAAEREQMLQCDFVTAANALVTQSLLDDGISRERILETSYGFNPKRLASAIDIDRPARPPVFAFVGMGIVRKGLDVLLEAWGQAAVEGKLLIAGEVDQELRHTYRDYFSRPDVQELGYVRDIASVYAAADIFVFPTHEEGGPQVTYEAAACALPSIVSAMGAGRIVRDRIEGIIVDPLDVESVAAAITTLADDLAMRKALGANAASRARDEFTWSKVGSRLYQLFRDVADSRAPSVLL